jgi:alanine dehydrogenase
MSTLILTKSDIDSLIDMPSVIDSVEQAFRDFAQGTAKMPSKAYLLVDKGDFRAMPAAVPGGAGVKWVNVHTGNRSVGLPTVMAVLIYSDPATGYPLAIMDATEITAYRTGATAAIASKYLARKNSRTLGMIGAGSQSYTQLMAHAELFQLTEIRVYDLFPTASEKLAKTFAKYPIRVASLEEAAACDIVCTLTPAREPILKKIMVKPGTHINAIGADAAGKEELEPSLLTGSIIVVDDMKQASGGGEINVPISKGIIKSTDIYGTLGEIIEGKKPGRKDNHSITIFDSTGVAIEDIATAKLLYEKANKSGTGLSVNLVD